MEKVLQAGSAANMETGFLVGFKRAMSNLSICELQHTTDVFPISWVEEIECSTAKPRRMESRSKFWFIKYVWWTKTVSSQSVS